MRLAASIVLMAIVWCCIAQQRAVAAESPTFIVTLLDERGAPIVGARIVATSSSGTFTATTDVDGRAEFDSIPSDTYHVTAAVSGYRAVVRDGVVIAPDQLLTVTFSTWHEGNRARPPDTALPGGTLVHDSLLGLFNSDHPEHERGEPYYGRYSYVLLRDGDDAVKAKNRAFVTKLVDRFAPSGSTIPVDAASRQPDNPLSYNVFFFPVGAGTADIKVSASHAGAADQILAVYDYAKARSIRDAYCSVPKHGSWSVCVIPYGGGPVLLTFLQPLSEVKPTTTMPPAFAYDFTSVTPEQFDSPLDTVQRRIAVTGPIVTDQLLPPPIAAYIANGLDALATALNAGLSGVRVWIDKQPGAPHGN